ncbi:cytochrome P450 [Nitrospirillum viridazoti]|uniref:Cytochrome n=1 Tax=Nitrospirillum viridazoti CBAmc TaxID=1441467 RepID=A0A248JVK8_9PROT|nr:cytochrome P450 [Nitrospirillum amazonense]ASG22254.1 cytochrome [Nitrospirillum amazonense CBAmc]TWB30980.1 cytochrome P450 [Nitrospirillum amazonense]
MPVYPMNMDVPAHVPPELVFDYDVYAPGPPESDFFEELYKLKGKAPPIFWTRNNGGHWYVADAKLVNQVLRDSDSFSSRMLVVPRANNPAGEGFTPIHQDPPDHTKYRHHLSVALSRKGVAELAPGVRQLAIELIEGLKPKGGCDFMTDFAFQLPIIVFLRLVDLPEEHRLGLLEEVAKIIRPGSNKAEVIRGLAAYLAPIVHARRENPADDLISWLSLQEIDGARMAEDKLLSMCTLLLIGGLDSVANTLGFFARFLAENPDHRRQIIDNPTAISSVVEELLRRFPTVTAGTGRLCVADQQVGPALVKAGDQVIAPPAMMNFDDTTYPDPLKVDFSRRINSVGTFGQGPHRCVGANLARSELTIFLEEWLTRIPDFRLAAGAPTFQPGINISYTRLMLDWSGA